MTGPNRESGFTLMETLVAFAIFSLSIVAILQSFSSSTRAQARSQATADAARLLGRVMSSAEARLDEPGEVSGTEGAVQWSLQVTDASEGMLAVRAAVIDEFGRVQSAETLRWHDELFPEPQR